jgi:hypothetical protein
VFLLNISPVLHFCVSFCTYYQQIVFSLRWYQEEVTRGLGRKQRHIKPNLVYSDLGCCQKNSVVFDLVAVTSRSNTDAPSIDDCASPLYVLPSLLFRYGHNNYLIFMRHVVYEICILNACWRHVMQQRTNKIRVILKWGNNTFKTSENRTEIKRIRDLISNVNVLIYIAAVGVRCRNPNCE